MSSSAGLKDIAKNSRIVRRAVRPPVTSRVTLAERDQQEVQNSANDEQEQVQQFYIKESSVANIVPAEPEVVVPEYSNSVEETLLVNTNKESLSKAGSKGKKNLKKMNHRLPRFEARLNSEHEKLVLDLNSKAMRQSHANNKGINNSELFGGLLEFVTPFASKIKFNSIDFKRGKLFGEATERIKAVVGKSIEHALMQYLIEELEKGRGGKFKEILNSLPEDRRQKIITELSKETTENLDEQLVVNG